MKTKKPSTKSSLLIFLQFIVVLISYLLAQTIAGVAFQILKQISSFAALIAYLIINISITTLLPWLYVRFVRKTTLSEAFYLTKLTFKTSLQFAVGMFIGVALFLITTIPLYLGGLYKISFQAFDIILFFSGIINFIGVGFGEEILVRGALQSSLLNFGAMPAVIISSVAFSLLHLANDNISIMAIINLCLAGLSLGMCMYATGNLWAPIGYHFTWNWIQGPILGIPVSGHKPNSIFETEILSSNILLTGGDFGAESSIFCTVVLTISCVIFYFIAKKNGNLEKFNAKKKSSSSQN